MLAIKIVYKRGCRMQYNLPTIKHCLVKEREGPRKVDEERIEGKKER